MVLGFGKRKFRKTGESSRAHQEIPPNSPPASPPRSPRGQSVSPPRHHNLPNATPAPGYPHIILTTDEHRRRFADLRTKDITPTRFFHQGLLRGLGIQDNMRDFFEGMNIPGFFTMDEYTYEDLTLEFFSTFELYENTAPKSVRFMLCGFPHYMGIIEWNNMLGCYVGDENAPFDFDHSALWRSLSNDILPANFRGVRANKIHHPVIRMGHRVIANTVYGRYETGVVTRHDLELIGSFLNVDGKAPFGLDIGLLIARHFAKIGKGGKKIAGISCGGVATYIAKHRLRTEYQQDLDESRYAKVSIEKQLDYECLSTLHGWLSQPHGLYTYQWQIRGRNTFTLPSTDLPIVRQTQATPGLTSPTSYLLPIGGAVPTVVPNIPDEGRFRHRGQTSRGGSSESRQPTQEQQPTLVQPPFQYQQPPTFQHQPQTPQDQTGLANMFGMMSFHFQQQERVMYPQYRDMQERGVVRRDDPSPAWWNYDTQTYDPSRGVSQFSYDGSYLSQPRPSQANFGVQYDYQGGRSSYGHDSDYACHDASLHGGTSFGATMGSSGAGASGSGFQAMETDTGVIDVDEDAEDDDDDGDDDEDGDSDAEESDDYDY